MNFPRVVYPIGKMELDRMCLGTTAQKSHKRALEPYQNDIILTKNNPNYNLRIIRKMIQIVDLNSLYNTIHV